MIEGILNFIKELKIRNEALFYFGLCCLSLSILFIVLTKLTTTQIHGVNAWFKPFKFAVSIGLFAWTMAWYCHYLSNFNPTPFNWTVIILFGFELAYITFQASKGQLSHFNFSTPLYAILYSLMGLSAVMVTLYTASLFYTFLSRFTKSLYLGYSFGYIDFCCFFI